MSHPLMYALGETETKEFPIILTIGREPNYDDALTNEIGKINVAEFSSMPSGAWVTAYTQFSKKWIGDSGTSRMLKDICFKKNASPIVFTNAFPMAIPNSAQDKRSIRQNIINSIPNHIERIFSKPIIRRVRLVVQHGTDKSQPSELAKSLIIDKCRNIGAKYCESPFFYNGNSMAIQRALDCVEDDIKSVFSEFNATQK